MTNLALAVLATSALACSAAPQPTGRAGQAPGAKGNQASKPASEGLRSAEPQLPVGVLAKAKGTNGSTITVEEHAGLHYLKINGVVQAALPLRDDRIGPDAIVALISAARPDAKSVLVIGLGSGKTAADLTSAGYEVRAVELEPRIIEYAKTYFGYAGHAVAGDGLAYLQKTTETYDVILMDAFTGIDPPRHLVTMSAFGVMRARLTERGAVVVRGIGEPTQQPMTSIFETMERAFRRPAPHLLMLGSGIGTEMQNLYLVASPRPLNLVEVKDLPMWPHRAGRGGPRPWSFTSLGSDRANQGASTRKIRAVGYLVRLSENGALALDLPHWEMGAVRFLLTGPKAAELARLLPAKTTFPTAGDLRSDGPTTHTLHEVLGGGGAKRSDLRFSTVIAQLEGSASLRSVVEPDAAAGVPLAVRGEAKTDKLIPYGGALYELVVEDVSWTLDRRGWSKSKRVLGPLVRKAVKRIRKDDLVGAATELKGYLKRLPAMLPANTPMRRQMESLVAGMRRATPGADAFSRAIACDSAAASFLGFGYDDSGADGLRVQRTLLECAERNYSKASIRPKAANARAAAARLLHLLESRAHRASSAGEKRLDATIAKLRKRHPGLESAASIPPVRSTSKKPTSTVP